MTAHNVSIRNHKWLSDDKLCAVIDRAYSGTRLATTAANTHSEIVSLHSHPRR